ncbi:TetR/AcrR family transcriptional regulator [Bacillus horti]|nr:TetR/AcrR family transcriptional regulator [Bacillus horti]
MNPEIPVPGSTQHRLIHAGLKRFSEIGYKKAEVDHIAADAGVTVGALYHHYRSKIKFYGMLRDDVTLRILDRMEAVAEAVSESQALKAAFLAAYDGMIKLKVGRLLSEPDPRNVNNAIADYLGKLAVAAQEPAGQELGILLAEALRAAYARIVEQQGDAMKIREALIRLL